VDDTIRALLVDDHPALMIGLRVLLDRAPDIAVVGEAENGPDALTLIAALEPDVTVLDCQMSGMSGAEVAMEVQLRGFQTRVLAMSAYTDDRYVYGMLEAGAVGYLLKDEAPDTIVEAVRAAARGQGYFSPPVADQAASWARGERPGGLTERELEVLYLLAEGKSNKEIAQALYVTVRTANFHVGNILSKLDAASRVEAVVWAKDHGIIA
jgi:NarL family two-component system response regulator LiaR